MDERREPPPEDGSRREIAADPGRLSPVQKAQQARAAHTGRCRQCRDIDRQRCAEGEELWQAWTTALDDAYEQLHGGTR